MVPLLVTVTVSPLLVLIIAAPPEPAGDPDPKLSLYWLSLSSKVLTLVDNSLTASTRSGIIFS